MFVGFLVCWFRVFVVSWFLGFLVSWFPTFKVSKFQGSHMTELPFHVFWKISIPYSRFPRRFETDLQDLSGPAFPDFFKVSDFRNVKISPNNMFFENELDSFLDYLSALASPKIKQLVPEVKDTFKTSPNHEHDEFCFLPS